MKRTLSVIVILLLCSHLLAEDGGGWPGLDQGQWESMTPTRLLQLLDTHDVNARGGSYPSFSFGWTALIHAARHSDNPEVIRVLIDAGTNVNVRDLSGRTALMLAAGHNDNPDAVRTLIEGGADVNAHEERGQTSMMLAAGHNDNPEIIRMLIDAGADVNARTERYRTAWYYMRRNEALRGTDIYWELNDLRFE